MNIKKKKKKNLTFPTKSTILSSQKIIVVLGNHPGHPGALAAKGWDEGRWSGRPPAAEGPDRGGVL